VGEDLGGKGELRVKGDGERKKNYNMALRIITLASPVWRQLATIGQMEDFTNRRLQCGRNRVLISLSEIYIKFSFCSQGAK
jgi:hypothetical protein